jgi:monoamine oxidase
MKSKTPLFATLRKAFTYAIEAEKLKTSPQEIIELAEEKALTRRKFLENTGKTLVTSYFLPIFPSNTEGGYPLLHFTKNPPRIAIVGAGIAGLNALHHLKKQGLNATIYESSGRTGGRIFTVKEAMGAGTWAEFGAEFIDTNHKDMWDLIKEFNLETIDYFQESEAKLQKEAFFFNNQHHTLAQVVEEFRGFAPRMKADMDKLPDDISYETKEPFVKKLDKTSLSDYLSQKGAQGWIKRFLEVAYESEYGLSPEEQSSLNLLTFISTDTEGGKFDLFGESDERYKVRGGNQSITDALAQKYAAHIETRRTLESIRKKGNRYCLHFTGMSKVVEVDFVILTIPFTILRNIDIKMPMPQVKWDCINHLGYGTNAKLMLGMNAPIWRQQGYTGLVYADNGIPNGWDNAQLQTKDNTGAGLSILFGGKSGVDVGKDSAEFQKNLYLPKWEQIFKGTKDNFSGKAARMHWPTYPHARGSYICPTLGQCTSIIGAEQIPVGNVYFAGEHCGGDFAGFMNGAAQSGREAAEAIVAKLRV